MNELKPCPFCGGEAHTFHNYLWHVKCEKSPYCCASVGAFITEAEALAAWNSRAERTCENAKLRQLIRYMEPWVENAGARKTVYRMMAELGIEVEQ